MIILLIVALAALAICVNAYLESDERKSSCEHLRIELRFLEQERARLASTLKERDKQISDLMRKLIPK